MSVEFKDYYETLGVGKSATQEEIKRAFKKLARAHHPDVAKDDDDAEARFKEINEAYEVLGDPEKRKKYDALGPRWREGDAFSGAGPGGFPGYEGFGEGREGAQWEYHFDGSTGFSDFFESLFGARAAGDPFGAFRGGGGGARRPRSDRPVPGQDIEADLLVRIEEIMRGASREIRLERPSADGGAKVSTIRVKIPKGVGEGQMIRCAGMGQPGLNGGPDGDLYLRVRVERHPLYRVAGHDLNSDLVLAPWEAVLGASVQVPTPHGDVRLAVKPRTQPGTRMRLAGKGLPAGTGFGDLYVNVVVEFPPDPSEEELRLWRELGEKSAFRPRP